MAYHQIGTDLRLYNDATTGVACLAVRAVCGSTASQGMSGCWLQGGTDERVYPTPISGNSQDMPMGIFMADASPGVECWLARVGDVLALPESGITATFGYVIYSSSSEAGRLAQSAAATVPTHWRENGHWKKTGSGNGTLTLASLHYL